MTAYDNWKTSPPENEQYDRLVEEVSDMSQGRLFDSCKDYDVEVEGKTNEQLRDELIETRAWVEEIPW